MFFPKRGIPARKVRIIMQFLLDETYQSELEIFPEQDGILK